MADETTQQKEPKPEDDTVHVDLGAEEEEGYKYSGPRAKATYVADQFRSMAHEVVDGLLRRVPPDVVEHVNNSRKELLLAFRGIIDRELTTIEKCTRHAYDLHKPAEEEKAETEKV